MKQVAIYTGNKKQYRVLEGERIVQTRTVEDMMTDTFSYVTCNARIESRDIGNRSWKGYARLAVETVERAKILCEKFVEMEIA